MTRMLAAISLLLTLPTTSALAAVNRVAVDPPSFKGLKFAARNTSTFPDGGAAQDAEGVEAGVGLDGPTRRLIQQGLRNEGFDPGTADGLFGPRTRSAIRDWQQSRGASSTGYVNGTEVELLLAAAPTPRPAVSQSSQPPEPVSEADPSAATASEITTQDAAETHIEPNARASLTTANTQLPQAILLDSYLLRAEQALRDSDREDARASMQRIADLQDEHELVLEPEYHYRYARVWHGVGAWDHARTSIVRYLALVGRDGAHYLDALTLMNRATAEIEAVEEARESRAAAEARAREAGARERAERERALNAARAVTARMEFATIPAGRFRMGLSESGRRRIGAVATDWWRGRVDVRISRAYDIGRYEVTQSEWETVMGTNPSGFGGCARCPVERVSWEDVQRFISLLNSAAADVWTYRLPTDAEWEYAARGGERDEFFARNRDESAWHRNNSEDRTQPVGLKRPNGFELYDMIGNVAELTQDWAAPLAGGTVVDPRGPSRPTSLRPAKVIRGCDYSDRPTVPCGVRRGAHLLERGGSRELGFRLVREPVERILDVPYISYGGDTGPGDLGRGWSPAVPAIGGAACFTATAHVGHGRGSAAIATSRRRGRAEVVPDPPTRSDEPDVV